MTRARARSLQSTSSDVASDPHSDSVYLDNGSLVIPDPDENDTVVREARIPKRKLLKNPGEESTPPEALPSENLVGINIHEDTPWDRDNTDEEDSTRQSRKKKRAAEEESYHAAESSPSSDEDDYHQERSFSRSLFTQEGQRKNASVIVPSNISINAKYPVEESTPPEASPS